MALSLGSRGRLSKGTYLRTLREFRHRAQDVFLRPGVQEFGIPKPYGGLAASIFLRPELRKAVTGIS